MSSKISIIIPNYNHKPYLPQRLNSVFGQTYQNFEVILLDDASTDGSQEVLELYKDHPKVTHFILNSQNSGSPFKQWEKGILLAKGELIWIAESDDFCEPIFLEQLLKRINDKTGICYSQTIDVDKDSKPLLNRIDYTQEFNPNIWHRDFEISGNIFNEKYLLYKNVIPNASAVIFKRNLVEDTIFSENLLQMKMCGDWFFWVKLCEKTTISFIAEPLNYFRSHSTISRNHHAQLKKEMRVLEEAEIRSFAYTKLHVNNKSKDKDLLRKWFNLFPLKAIFSRTFYNIPLTFENKLSLLLKFLRFKLKNCLL